jgi:predicted nucleic acid-binding protein
MVLMIESADRTLDTRQKEIVETLSTLFWYRMKDMRFLAQNPEVISEYQQILENEGLAEITPAKLAMTTKPVWRSLERWNERSPGAEVTRRQVVDAFKGEARTISDDQALEWVDSMHIAIAAQTRKEDGDGD